MKIQKTLLLDSLGTGTEYIWEEVGQISNIENEQTIEVLLADDNEYVLKFNWENLYGKLDERRI